jgi:RNA polymerase sigma-70 factor (ECF subfamily)
LQKYKNWSDEELISVYQQSEDIASVATLFDRYAEIISMICLNYLKNKQDAEDGFMDLFEQVTIDLKTTQVQNFSAWLNAVVRHHCLKVKRQREKFAAADIEQFSSSEWSEPIKEINEQIDASKELNAAMQTLKPDQERCVFLFYTQQKSYKEIADELNMDMNTVKSHIQNGKRKLKIELEKRNVNANAIL